MSGPMREMLRADIAEALEIAPSEVDENANLMDMGLDSMRAMNLATVWEERGLPLDFGDLGEAETLAQLAALAERRQVPDAA